MTYKETLLTRVEFVLKNAEKAIEKEVNNGIAGITIGYTEMKSFRTSGLSMILNLFGDKHPYYEGFKEVTEGYAKGGVVAGSAIINNVKTEIENDWLSSVKAIVSAEIFSDFMDMADHLLENHYKDAAAVMIGSVLEEHIRQICSKNGIRTTQEKDGKQVPLKADRMNSELVKADVYNKLDQKSVTTSLDLRNKAAHGHYDEYDESQVKVMYTSVLDFITRHQL